MSSTIFNLTSIQNSFTNWLAGSTKAGHLTTKNVSHIVDAFNAVIKKKGNLQDFETKVQKMQNHFKTPQATAALIVNEAKKALGNNKNKAKKPTTTAVSHNAKKWLQNYDSNKNDPAAQKKMRAEIFKETQSACKNGFLVGGKELKISKTALKKMQDGTKVIVTPSAIKAKANKQKTDVEVINDVTSGVAQDLQKKGFKVVILNMANKDTPGGGAKSGARAQEECLFRESNAFQSLYPSENSTLAKQLQNGKYEVPEFGAIYSPSVTLLRKPQEAGFAFQKPFEVDMISNAAYNLSNGVLQHYKSKMKAKIRAILRVADGTGHDAVVLGAHGCGAFKNDPQVVSKLFKKVLKEPEFSGVFRKVAFAIIDDQNSNGNLATFKKAFKNFKM